MLPADRTLSRPRAAVRVLVALTCVMLLGQLAAAPPAARGTPIRSRTATVVTADSLPTAQVNGVVWSQAVVGDTVFAAGEFTSVRPAGAALGTDESARHNLMSFSLSTGVATSFAPDLDGVVKVLALSADQSTLMVGGQFTHVDGLPRRGFAAFSVATGRLTPLAPDVNATVNAMATIGRVVYLAGAFNQVNGVARTRLAAINVDSGALTTWAPQTDASVQALVATPDQGALVVGGSFTTLGGASALGMGSVDAATGVARPWAANKVIRDYGDNAAILTLAADQDTIYGGGYTFGEGNFEGVFAADPTTGAVRWLQDCHGDTYDVAPLGDQVYSVGHAHFCTNIGGFPDTKPRTAWRRALAVTKQVTGTVDTNTQVGSAYEDFGGRPASSLYNWFPDIDSGTYTGLSQGAWSVTGTSDYLLLGGEFPRVNFKGQQGLARFAVPRLAPNRQGPRMTADATTPTATVQAGRVVLTWPANWDRDDQLLSYDVLRDGTTIATVTAASQFWRRPTLRYQDRTGAPGVSYRYQIRVRDPDGNKVTSPGATATYPSDDSYARQIRTDGAAHQWRLGARVGQTSEPDQAGALPLSILAGVDLGVAGAIRADVDTAAAWDGSSTALAQSAVGPQPAGATSVEGWFRTSSPAGGALVGFGSSLRSAPGEVGMRQVYLDGSGRLNVSVRPTAAPAVTVTSPTSWADGAWHCVVAVQSTDEVRLYVDGAPVATSRVSASTSATAGRWVLGGSTPSDLPARPAGSYTGALDEVAVFNYPLTPRQAYEHHKLGAPRFRIIGVRQGEQDSRR